MRKLKFRTLGLQIRRTAKSAALYRVLAPHRCGPFDGGCVIVARALRSVLGGKVYGVYDGRVWHHAVLSKAGWLLDGDGVMSWPRMYTLWQEREFLSHPRLDWMPKDQELSRGTPIAAITTVQMAALFMKRLKPQRVMRGRQRCATS